MSRAALCTVSAKTSALHSEIESGNILIFVVVSKTFASFTSICVLLRGDLLELSDLL